MDANDKETVLQPSFELTSDNEMDNEQLPDNTGRSSSRSEGSSDHRFCLGFSPNMTHSSSSYSMESNVNVSDVHVAVRTVDMQCIGDDVESILKQNLPQYIVNCFLAAGYDTLAEIAKMDVSTKTAVNPIDTIESFINEQFPGDKRFTHFGSNKCKIPPGHRSRNTSFIKNVIHSEKLDRRVGTNSKRTHDGANLDKVSKNKWMRKADKTSQSTNPNLHEIYTKLRNSLCKWQRTTS